MSRRATTEYGFAVSATLADLHLVGRLNADTQDGLTSVQAGPLDVFVRHYASTPEAVAETLPRVSPDLLLIYEGRVDNREEIADRLGQPELARSEDGAVLSAAYRAWNQRLSQMVVGEYAYIVFDRVRRRLIAGQDSLGVRRLFYGFQSGRVWITSNLRLFFQLFPEARPAINGDVLPEYFAGALWPWSGATLWRGVRELRRGKVLVQSGATLEEQSDWRPAEPSSHRTDRADAVDHRLRQLIFDAVHAALRSPGPVLCDLSGGYDSSAICAVAGRLARSDAHMPRVSAWCYTHHQRSNELLFQRAVGRHAGIDLHVLDVAEHLPFQVLGDTEVPTGGGFLQMGAVSAAVRQLASSTSIRCRLSGHGGDGLFFKGPPAPLYLSDWLREGRLADWSTHVSAYLRAGSYNLWHLLRDCSVGTLDMRAARFAAPAAEWLTPMFRRRVTAANRHFTHHHERTFSSIARERLYRSIVAFIPYNGQMLPDERLPFLHRPLVEFILGLDWSHLVHPREERYLMRRALRDVLPSELRTEGAKSPHTATLIEGLRSAWRQVSPLLTGERLAAFGVIEPAPFRAAIERFRAGYQGTNAQHTKTAMYLELWLALKDSSGTA